MHTVHRSPVPDNDSPSVRAQLDTARLLTDVITSMSEVDDFDEAMAATLEAVCSFTSWPVGQLWLPTGDGARLMAGPSWSQDVPELRKFLAANVDVVHRPGECVSGEVWRQGTSVLLAGIQTLGNCSGCAAGFDAGLVGTLGFPILHRGEVIGVLTCWVFDVRGADDALVEAVETVSSAIGSLLSRRHVEETLRATAEEAQRLSADLQQFAYVASHDLQEPVRMVASFVQLLAARSGHLLDEESTEYLNFAREGAERMNLLVNDLLRYASLNVTGPQKHVDLNDVFDDCVAMFASEIFDRGARVTATELPVVLAERSVVVQVVQNLIRNALVFSEPHVPPVIRVTAEACVGRWVISVEDNGIGVPEDQRERIFLPFRRVHGRAKYPGTGVGLAICRKVVEGFGGAIWVEPRAGGGSVFRFSLPAAKIPRLVNRAS